MGLVLSISYNDIYHLGWQSQLKFSSLEDLFQFLLFKITGRIIKLASSSRTDKGVHSLIQNIYIDFYFYRLLKITFNSINKYLLNNIFLVNFIKIIDNNFHPRYSTLSRTYCYILCIKKLFNNLFIYNYVFFTYKNINFYYIIFFLKFLVGVQNFFYFSSLSFWNKLYIRIIYKFIIIKKKNFVFFIFTGNSFLYNMIRNIFSNIFFDNYYKIILVLDLFYLKKKKNYKTLISSGLYLISIKYPVVFNL